MNNRLVPKSKFEANQQYEHRRGFKPGSGERHEIDAKILYVFDPQNIRLENAPPNIIAETKTWPGKLFAAIQLLNNNRVLVRPFEDAADHIFLIYGNSALLEGRPVKLVYENGRVETGLIRMTNAWDQQNAELPVATETWDIGAIV